MVFSKDWWELWRRFRDFFPDGSRKAVDLLRQRYIEEMQQIARFKQHAQKMHYPQFHEKLLEIATDKSKRADWIAEKIGALGGKLPEVAERSPTDENSWRHLLMDLEEEKRCADHLPEQLWSLESGHPDIIKFLQQISQEQKKHREEIRNMLMRSDPFALSLA